MSHQRHDYLADRNRRVLNDIICRNRLKQAYIFYGPSTALLREAAIYLAKMACCSQRTETVTCGTCRSCLGIDREHYADVAIMSSTKDRLTIDYIREIQTFVKYGPSQGKRMLVIVPECHRLTQESANAFLKTLEEPPDNVTFILLTSMIKHVLPTIRSRCQSLDFPPLPVETIITYLKQFEPDVWVELSRFSPLYNEYIYAFLDRRYIFNTPLTPFNDVVRMTMVDRLTLSETLLASDKDALHYQLLLWSQEICDGTPEIFSRYSNFLKQTIDIISQLQYNLNRRLQLDSLLVQL